MAVRVDAKHTAAATEDILVRFRFHRVRHRPTYHRGLPPHPPRKGEAGTDYNTVV